MKNILLTFLLSLCSFSVLASGGTVVGNGAGAVESSFQQAYYSLEKIIPSCLAVIKCELADDERIEITKILSIVNRNANKKDRLVFLSEKLNPGFFTTGNSEVFRIAKTFLNPDAPIYINTDMLYKDDGQPAIKFQDIVRILVHELGHQTGIEDHASLDILGSKVASYSEDSTFYYRYKIEGEAAAVTFAVTNFDRPVKSTFVVFNWKDSKMQDLTGSILMASSCAYDSESYAGIEVTNGHFSFNYNGTLSFDAWVNVSCSESFSANINVYRRNLRIDLDSEFKLMNMTVK
ncbi:MAG: hypothetical protein H7281_12500 [Bacteriovorax sp.]|nr:hypothetical protein [Bacteriovorax sp.]